MSDDRFDNRRYHNEDTFSIQSTAGAIPIKNKKGEISMEKVKVHRYVSGKRPEYAKGRHSSSESESSDEDDFITQRQRRRPGSPKTDDEDEDDGDDHEDVKPVFAEPYPVKIDEDVNDPRLKRLRAARETTSGTRHDASDDNEEKDDEEEDRMPRHRRIHEAEILSDAEDDDEDDDKDAAMESDDSSSGEEDLDDEGIQRRRELMRQRAMARAQIGMGQEEVMAKEDEKSASEKEDDEDETTEEETDSSDDEEGVRMKPRFIPKNDRMTIKEKERQEAKERQAEREAQLLADQRRRDTKRMVENTVKLEMEDKKKSDPDGLLAVNTDDENEEVEYEAWKLRELKRLKRDRDEKEERDREQAETERLRNMTEEERRLEAKQNPKRVTNKAAKGKYKFLQKYYHRGAFFLDKEQDVFKRDISHATLEDKFDKTVLPKVMQVKNFGRSGRTKYTHLVDQDTTQFDAAWSQESAQNVKFQVNHAAGMKNVFERPSAKKKK